MSLVRAAQILGEIRFRLPCFRTPPHLPACLLWQERDWTRQVGQFFFFLSLLSFFRFFGNHLWEGNLPRSQSPEQPAQPSPASPPILLPRAPGERLKGAPGQLGLDILDPTVAQS